MSTCEHVALNTRPSEARDVGSSRAERTGSCEPPMSWVLELNSGRLRGEVCVLTYCTMGEEDDRRREEEEKEEEEEEVASKSTGITMWKNRVVFFYFMCTGILPACMSANHVCSTLRGQKELALEVAVSHCVDDGNQTQVLR